MADLSGLVIKDNRKGMLNLGSISNVPLSTTLQNVTDGIGNDSPLQLATDRVSIQSKTEYSWVSPPVGAVKKTTLFFDLTGRMSWRNETGFLRTFDATGITADRVYTLPNETTVLAGLAVANSFTERQAISPPSLTGSSALSALNITQTLNTTGAPDIISLSVTNTASSTTTNLINCKVDNVSAFSVNRLGATRIGLVSGNNWTFSSNQLISSQNAFISAAGSVGVVLSSSALVGGVLANASGGKVCDTGVSTAITASAVLEVVSTTKGFLPPRMTSAQRLAISSPATGLMVYQTDGTEGLYIKKSGAWTFII